MEELWYAEASRCLGARIGSVEFSEIFGVPPNLSNVLAMSLTEIRKRELLLFLNYLKCYTTLNFGAIFWKISHTTYQKIIKKVFFLILTNYIGNRWNLEQCELCFIFKSPGD